MEKLQDEVKVGCLMIKMRAFKEAVDGLIQACLERLMDELKLGLKVDIDMIETASLQGIDKLRQQPSTP